MTDRSITLGSGPDNSNAVTLVENGCGSVTINLSPGVEVFAGMPVDSISGGVVLHRGFFRGGGGLNFDPTTGIVVASGIGVAFLKTRRNVV